MTTDINVALWILILSLSGSALLGLSLWVSLLPQWWQSISDRSNGPKTVLMRGMMRRRLIQFILHAALLAQFGYRALMHRPAPLLYAVVVLLVIVFALIGDTIADMYEYRLLRALLRDEYRST